VAVATAVTTMLALVVLEAVRDLGRGQRRAGARAGRAVTRARFLEALLRDLRSARSLEEAPGGGYRLEVLTPREDDDPEARWVTWRLTDDDQARRHDEGRDQVRSYDLRGLRRADDPLLSLRLTEVPDAP
jgi:hypothetical protein